MKIVSHDLFTVLYNGLRNLWIADTLTIGDIFWNMINNNTLELNLAATSTD